MLGIIAEELQLAGGMSGGELVQEQSSKQLRQHAYRKEKIRAASDPAVAVERESAARDDHVDVRMVGERRAPGLENGEEAEAGTEVLGIGWDRQHGLRGGFEQQVVDHGLVLISDIGDPARQ